MVGWNYCLWIHAKPSHICLLRSWGHRRMDTTPLPARAQEAPSLFCLKFKITMRGKSMLPCAFVNATCLPQSQLEKCTRKREAFPHSSGTPAWEISSFLLSSEVLDHQKPDNVSWVSSQPCTQLCPRTLSPLLFGCFSGLQSQGLSWAMWFFLRSSRQSREKGTHFPFYRQERWGLET